MRPNDEAEVELLDVADANVLAYTRRQGNSSITVALNFGNAQADVTIGGTTWTIPAYGYQWDADGATAIHTPLATTSDHACYTLGGVKVAEPHSKGIYIRDGRKFLMR